MSRATIAASGWRRCSTRTRIASIVWRAGSRRARTKRTISCRRLSSEPRHRCDRFPPIRRRKRPGWSGSSSTSAAISGAGRWSENDPRRSFGPPRAPPLTRPSNSALIAKDAVWGALDALHPRRRAIVIMCELEGMTPSAIGSLLGVSTMTVRWHLSMGRRDLKRLLTPQTGDTI